MQLLENPDIDETLRTCPRRVHILNPNFYLMLFKIVEIFRERQVTEGNHNVVALLDQLESKMYEYTDTIPADLPDSILINTNLTRVYLFDDSGVFDNPRKWDEFQTAIGESLNSITQDLALPFLNWCVQMLKMNLARHNKNCPNQLICKVNKGYDRRLHYLKRLIEENTPNQIITPHFSEPTRKPVAKIQWLGSQKELAELFVELMKKGWIEKIENETIQTCFTESKSVPQYLKPCTDTKTGEDTYENLYTGYTPQFYGIKENPKQHK